MFLSAVVECVDEHEMRRHVLCILTCSCCFLTSHSFELFGTKTCSLVFGFSYLVPFPK